MHGDDFCALRDEGTLRGETGRLSMDGDESRCEVIFVNRVLRTVRSENRPSFEIGSDPPTHRTHRERVWTAV